MSLYSVDKLIGEARRLAVDYRRATGKSLPGISAEIALYDAISLLGLTPVEGQTVGGYDALGTGEREGQRIQIKGRVIHDDLKSGQRIGQIKIDQQWDVLLLVLLDAEYQPLEIYEADRDTLVQAVDEHASARNKRGIMSLARFKAVARLVWSSDAGPCDDGLWDNRAGT